MTIDSANKIANWQYPPPYDLYSMDASKETLSALLSDDYYLVSTPNNPQFGYFCLGDEGRVPGGYLANIYDHREDVIDLGLGMHPDETGRGLGRFFVIAILNWIEINLCITEVRLVVATFNRRAIRTYENNGFKHGDLYRSRKLGHTFSSHEENFTEVVTIIDD